MKDLTEQIYDELNAQVVRMLNHSLNQASRIVELETQLKDHSAQAFSIGETYANALSRIAELEAKLAEVPHWISVDERLPEKGVNVLVWERWCNTPFIGSYEYKKWHPSDEVHDVTGYDGSIVHNVTQGDVMFWQPLPAAPAHSEVL